jgi:pSer/pThr/pTyr-binding forkhead associated (FHA) protein
MVFPVVQAKARAYGSVLVGRAEDNDVRVAEESVSGEHAALNHRPVSGDWWLMDCGSKNGTKLQGRKLVANEWMKLPDRAVISLGHVELRFLLPGSLVDYLYVRSQ